MSHFLLIILDTSLIFSKAAKVANEINIRRLLLLLLLMVCSLTARAEGRCPPGYFPTTNPDFVGCAPIYSGGQGSGYSSPTAPKPPNPGPHWKFRWGAIVVDGEKGKFGGADGFDRPSQATKAAVKMCQSHGGKKCEVVLEYYNQCGTLVWGDGGYSGHSGPVPDEVSKRALESCGKETTNCQIYYMGCSYPVEAD